MSELEEFDEFDELLDKCDDTKAEYVACMFSFSIYRDADGGEVFHSYELESDEPIKNQTLLKMIELFFQELYDEKD